MTKTKFGHFCIFACATFISYLLCQMYGQGLIPGLHIPLLLLYLDISINVFSTTNTELAMVADVLIPKSWEVVATILLMDASRLMELQPTNGTTPN